MSDIIGSIIIKFNIMGDFFEDDSFWDDYGDYHENTDSDEILNDFNKDDFYDAEIMKWLTSGYRLLGTFQDSITYKEVVDLLYNIEKIYEIGFHHKFDQRFNHSPKDILLSSTYVVKLSDLINKTIKESFTKEGFFPENITLSTLLEKFYVTKKVQNDVIEAYEADAQKGRKRCFDIPKGQYLAMYEGKDPMINILIQKKDNKIIPYTYEWSIQSQIEYISIKDPLLDEGGQPVNRKQLFSFLQDMLLSAMEKRAKGEREGAVFNLGELDMIFLNWSLYGYINRKSLNPQKKLAIKDMLMNTIILYTLFSNFGLDEDLRGKKEDYVKILEDNL
jgi:hypothetical protein